MSISDTEFVVATARQKGWCIIPVNSDKTPRVHWKKYQNSHPTAEEFSAWLKDGPPVWAVVTGRISNVIVLDFDGEKGRETLKRLGLNPHVRTGSDGRHVYLHYPGWYVRTISGSAWAELARLFPGLDIRADGGYAIFAGCTDRGPYEWLRPMEPDSLDLLPSDLRELLGLLNPPPPQTPPQAAAAEVADQERSKLAGQILGRAVLDAPSKGRNNAGFWLAIQLRDNGFAEHEALAFAQQFQQKVPGTNSKGEPEAYTVEEAEASVRSAFAKRPRDPWSTSLTTASSRNERRITIKANNRDLSDLSAECMTALRFINEPEFLFVRSGQMVIVVCDETGRHVIREVSEPMLRGFLSDAVEFREFTKDRWGNWVRRAVSPPLDVVKDILARFPQMWRLPALQGISAAPVVRPNGTIVVTSGYDRDTRLVYAPKPDLRLPAISDDPTPEEVEAANKLLREMIADFPFVDEASRTNCLAPLLTGLLRAAIRGNVPVTLIDAPSPGTGKSLIAEEYSLVLTGSNAAMQPAPGRDDEEWRKVLTAILWAGHPLTVFDNLACPLQSAFLAQAITSTVWQDRILGQSKTITLTQQTIWIVTGNNIVLGGDLPRRCYWIRLDAQVANPWQRRTFAIPDVKRWTSDHRGELLAALLTLIRSWYAAGCPAAEVPRLGGFEDWAKTIGSILHHAGHRGFLENLERLYEQTDPSEVQWEQFLFEIYSHYQGREFTAAELATALRANTAFHMMLPDDLIDDDRGGSNLFQRKIGTSFRQRIDRRYGEYGVHIVRAGDGKRAKVVRWNVKFSTPPPLELTAPPVGLAPLVTHVPCPQPRFDSPLRPLAESAPANGAPPPPVPPQKE